MLRLHLNLAARKLHAYRAGAILLPELAKPNQDDAVRCTHARACRQVEVAHSVAGSNVLIYTRLATNTILMMHADSMGCSSHPSLHLGH